MAGDFGCEDILKRVVSGAVEKIHMSQLFVSNLLIVAGCLLFNGENANEGYLGLKAAYIGNTSNQ